MRLVCRLLSGIGEPYVIVRLGYVEPAQALPATPRRSATDVIHIDRQAAWTA